MNRELLKREHERWERGEQVDFERLIADLETEDFSRWRAGVRRAVPILIGCIVVGAFNAWLVGDYFGRTDDVSDFKLFVTCINVVAAGACAWQLSSLVTTLVLWWRSLRRTLASLRALQSKQERGLR